VEAINGNGVHGIICVIVSTRGGKYFVYTENFKQPVWRKSTTFLQIEHFQIVAGYYEISTARKNNSEHPVNRLLDCCVEKK
jgi:hypothetical protein